MSPRVEPSPMLRAGALALLLALPACGSCGSCNEGCKPSEEEHAIDLPAEAGPRVIEVVLPSPPDEGGEQSVLSTPAPELGDVVRILREAASRDQVEGVFLRLGAMGGAWGRAGDLIGALQGVRDAGKPVHCHFDGADNVSMLVLARACDRTSMAPAGVMDLVGPAAQVFYARTLLDKIGVQAQLVQMGKYKGAADPFTRADMPEPVRESLGAVLDDLHGAIVDALVKGRGLSRTEAEAAVDGGPYDAEGAKKAGLVDAVEFDDEAREHAREAGDAPRVTRVHLVPRGEPIGLGDLLSALTGEAPSPQPTGKRLGLVILEGTIVDAERQGLAGVRSGPVVRKLREMARDDDIEAVVLRIDSPGGSALASDAIWHAVRRVAKHKPVIASIGDMAASGGYYIASAATEILAPDQALVGSIGVVGGKVQMTELADKLGVHVVVLKRGEHAAWMSPFEPMTDTEHGILERFLARTYARFIHRVSVGRGISESKVRAAAEGRLMTAARGRELGLVDQAGGYEDALTLARKKADLPADAPVERWPEKRTVLDAIAEAVGGGDRASVTRSLLDAAGPFAGPLSDALLLPGLLQRERTLVTLPYVVRIR